MMYFVFLRRPRGLDDPRDDPFWEFGSFGRTGCHRSNLMRPQRTPLRDGDRLAFLQGGRGEIRLTALTPPIKVMPTPDGVEARWDNRFKPFRFWEAPIFIDNSGHSDIPGVLTTLDGTLRSTWCGKAGSRFRSRMQAIDKELAASVTRTVDRWQGILAAVYLDAIGNEASAWNRHGMSEGWARARQRRSLFLRLGGLPIPREGSTSEAMPTSLSTRKRRC